MSFYLDPVLFMGQREKEAYMDRAVEDARSEKLGDPEKFRKKFKDYLSHIEDSFAADDVDGDAEQELHKVEAGNRKGPGSVSVRGGGVGNGPQHGTSSVPNGPVFKDSGDTPKDVKVRGDSEVAGLTQEEEDIVRSLALFEVNMMLGMRKSQAKTQKKSNKQRKDDKKENERLEQEYLARLRAKHKAQEKEAKKAAKKKS